MIIYDLIVGLFLPGFIINRILINNTRNYSFFEQGIISVMLTIIGNLLISFYTIYLLDLNPSQELIREILAVYILLLIIIRIIQTRFFSKRSINPKTPRVLFLTRNYPPVIGGLENLSYNLTTNIKLPKKIISLGKSKRIHMFWFIPYIHLYVIFNGHKYDIIHCNDFQTYMVGIWKFLFPYQKFITTVHGLDVNFANKKGLLSSIYRFCITVMRVFFNPDKIYAISKFPFGLAKDLGLKNLEIINPGINIEDLPKLPVKNIYKEDKFKLPKEAKILSTIGRLTKRKGQVWFVENVMPLLPENYYYFIGGKSYYLEGVNEEDRLNEKIIELGLSDRVVFEKLPNDKDKFRMMRDADLFVMPNITTQSTDAEGFGIVALESAYLGTPVIASDMEGMQDSVIHGKTGIHVEPENPTAFAKEIISYCEGKKHKSLYKTCSFEVEKHFAWSTIAKKYKVSFKNLVS